MRKSVKSAVFTDFFVSPLFCNAVTFATVTINNQSDMKSLVITAFMLLTLAVGANAQENQKVFTAEEQAIVDLSNSKWDWMSEKNVEKLAELFHENSQFVHMGGYWGKQQELETIRTGGIWYKKAEIHDVQVKFAAGTATVYSRIHLNSVVGGNAVRDGSICDGKRQMATLHACLYKNFGRIINENVTNNNSYNMKNIQFITFAICLSTLACHACSNEEIKPDMEQSETPSENPDTPPEAATIQMTEAVPEQYFRTARQQGTVEMIGYISKDYAGSMAPTTKPAYIYLPYGYDANQQYDIIYLIHGWTGTAEQYFGLASWPQMKNLFDNMIQNGDCKPFIAVSPTWDKDNRSKGWSESTEEVAAFHNEYLNELIPAVESRYSTYAETFDKAGILASRDHRAFGGFSLGSITTWYIFEHCFDLQKWFLPMSGDNWHIQMFGGQYEPEATAQFLAEVVNASDYKDNFYVWYAVGTRDSRFYQTHNQALAMMELPETFNETNFSYHQKEGGQHDFNSVWEFCYNALPFFFPKNDDTNNIE